MDNIFEFASRYKLRFASVRGELSVEQLWDVPLRSTDNFNLDFIARNVNKALKDASEESFVSPSRNPAQNRLELSLEIVKHVIQSKLTDEELARKRKENKVEKEKLLEILAEKQLGKLSSLSEKELRKRIEALET